MSTFTILVLPQSLKPNALPSIRKANAGVGGHITTHQLHARPQETETRRYKSVTSASEPQPLPRAYATGGRGLAELVLFAFPVFMPAAQ